MITPSILLVTLTRFEPYSKLCISNYKYISRHNKLHYQHKKLYQLSDILDSIFDIIICMNDFSLFISPKINSLLSLISQDTSLVLPNNTHMPLEITPFCIKNCAWSRKFIELYLDSKYYNTHSFIENLEQNIKQNIVFTDVIHCPGERVNNKHIVRQLTDTSLSLGQELMKQHNTKLGII